MRVKKYAGQPNAKMLLGETIDRARFGVAPVLSAVAPGLGHLFIEDLRGGELRSCGTTADVGVFSPSGWASAHLGS